MEHTSPLPTSSLGQFFTVPEVGDVLVSKIIGDTPRLILDLGSGKGALSCAALRRWAKATLISVDIDEHVGKQHRADLDQNALARYAHIHADALSSNLGERLGIGHSSVDVAVCNPPYAKLRWRKHFGALLEEVGLDVLPPSQDVPAELIFLAQNLRLLSHGGQAGLIVPDGFITGRKYLPLRHALLKEHSIQSVIQLPAGSFVGTEARAHIVVLAKQVPHTRTVELASLSKAGGLGSPIHITLEEAEERLDFAYHHVRSNGVTPLARPLGSIATAINRGKLSSAQVRTLTIPTFHLNDFSKRDFQNRVQLAGCKDIISAFSEQIVAQPGDILLARVGRNLETQVCMVASGYAILSDCIYRVKVPRAERVGLLQRLCSERGRVLLSSAAHGSAARHLSKQDLANLRP